ncbi:hypothetical protein JCM9140_1858 [Halalkalibacter wakoensis JCM 9140]|uniref:Secreted protein n=1 Tax=Halalkalibacter wakoensis JCM 9140 TaxID=1236970 RepID=W4Q1J9_9BACI|nr:DUF2953 domain-containing protein [Halalkalibacter wakoensis]GAE25840.1 hypothetical protein JCM9140_1858 [Halalkalibacter wakoensis JCM 9140]
MVWTIVILALILLFIIVAASKIKIYVDYKHNKDDDLLEAKVTFWGMKVYSFSAPVIKVDDDSASLIVEEEQKIAGMETKKALPVTPELLHDYFRWLKDFLDHVVGLHKIVKKFLKKVSVNSFTWHTDIGVGDAAHTAQLAGAIWGVKGNIVGLIGNYMRMKFMPKLSVDPHFQAMVSHTYLSCMFSFRIGHAILAGLMLLKHWRRRPKMSQTNSVEKNM